MLKKTHLAAAAVLALTAGAIVSNSLPDEHLRNIHQALADSLQEVREGKIRLGHHKKIYIAPAGFGGG